MNHHRGWFLEKLVEGRVPVQPDLASCGSIWIGTIFTGRHDLGLELPIWFSGKLESGVCKNQDKKRYILVEIFLT